jgi:predicted dinucleotide-binding enzyme
MKLAILGTGMVGRAIAGKLTQLSHDVMIGTRDLATLMARTEPDGMGNPPFSVWHAQNQQIKVNSFAGAAAHGKIVFNCTNGAASLDILPQAGEINLTGKVLVDMANPLDFSQGMPPSLSVSNTNSLGEQIQRAFP